MNFAPHDKAADPVDRDVATNDLTQLLIGGSRYSFRCDCQCNVFRRIADDLFQCNGCRKQYESQ